jgi:hypothetical protein
MCFSAAASFGASAVLAAVGVVTLKNAKTPAQVPFAMIPLLFAVQQAAEGMLWIGLSGTNHESWRHFPVYIFLIFAQVVWPVWVPLSILQLEKDKTRRKLLSLLLTIGSAITLYLMYCLIVYDVTAQIHGGHIQYTLSFPVAFVWIASVFYFMPTVFPLFTSSFKRMWILGVTILLSFIIAKIYFEEHLISVWCFFAAVISIAVLIILKKSNKEAKLLISGEKKMLFVER